MFCERVQQGNGHGSGSKKLGADEDVFIVAEPKKKAIWDDENQNPLTQEVVVVKIWVREGAVQVPESYERPNKAEAYEDEGE